MRFSVRRNQGRIEPLDAADSALFPAGGFLPRGLRPSDNSAGFGHVLDGEELASLRDTLNK